MKDSLVSSPNIEYDWMFIENIKNALYFFSEVPSQTPNNWITVNNLKSRQIPQLCCNQTCNWKRCETCVGPKLTWFIATL